jgi:hypothetical protein
MIEHIHQSLRESVLGKHSLFATVDAGGENVILIVDTDEKAVGTFLGPQGDAVARRNNSCLDIACGLCQTVLGSGVWRSSGSGGRL